MKSQGISFQTKSGHPDLRFSLFYKGMPVWFHNLKAQTQKAILCLYLVQTFCIFVEEFIFMPPLFVECGRALSVAHVRPSVHPSVRPSFR